MEKREKKELLDVIESGYLYRYGNASDPKFKQKVLTLEKNFAKKVGVKQSLALSSGTAA
ncbi:MAG: hypothetical protein ACTSUL_03980 [Promethearchaeota archaeon]